MLRGEREVAEAEPRAAGPDPPGPGDLVPAAQHRRAERGDAAAPADRGRARATSSSAARFAQVISARRGRRRPGRRTSARCSSALRIRPVITAHPTEAKRVTVLEKHRRIYRRLVELESPRWTPRERQALVDGLRNEIELLWLTGELRLAKPTVPQEVFWGLHFFNETLFEAVPDLMEKVERALAQYYPGERSSRAAVLPVRLLDRRRPRRQSVRHQRRHPQHAAGEPAHGAPALPPAARRAGARAQHHRARGAAVATGSAQALERELARHRRRRGDRAAAIRARSSASTSRACSGGSR